MSARCIKCGETYSDNDLKELKSMGEIFHKEKGSFFCPDCWDNFCHLDLEDQIDETLKEDDKDV